MAAGNWTFTDNTRTALLNGTLDLDTGTYRLALFLSTSNLATSSNLYSSLTNEHATANGYTQTGQSYGVLTLSGTTTVTVDDPLDIIWTASGGSIVAKWAVLYESGSSKIVAYFLLESGGADVTTTTGNTLTVALNASGIFTLA